MRTVLSAAEPPLTAESIDDVCLIASELVTNSYRYGTEPGDSLRVTVVTATELIRVEVHDPVRRLPRKGHSPGERVRGRGLHIVTELALRWGTENRPFGKAVWAEVKR